MERDRRIRAAMIVCAPLCPLSQAQYGGGTGTADDPYLIYTLQEFNETGLDKMCGLQTSKATGCDGTAGKMTGQMGQRATFLAAGWDLVDETQNGTEEIWFIDEGLSYPRLTWELLPDGSAGAMP